MQTQHKFISRFSPNRTDPEDLERINVQREDLLARSVAVLRESVLTDNKHHLLFIGPRGSGKSHLLTLIAHRLQGQPELADGLRLAWLNEDETSTSFLDLLLRVFRALGERYPAEFPLGDIEQLTGRDRAEALELLCRTLVSRAGQRTILVMLENLDTLFSQLDESEQRAWRAFIQNHPIFATVATAQSLFAGVSQRDEPFFGFFDTTHLQPFTVQEATELLQRIAQLNQDAALVEFLATPRGKARVRAIHHLSGGNPRLYIVLSDFITRQSLDELVRPFEGMVDEQLTPYYQERLRWLSPQQRKIVEFLCLRGRPAPVKEIAAALFAEQTSIAGQLLKLRKMRYVKTNPRGRESLYELAEPLMRLSMEVKNTRNHQPLRLLVDFLRVWFERDELERLSARCEVAGMGREYVSAALAKLQRGEPDLRRELLLQGIEDVDIEHCDADQLEQLRLLAEDSNAPADWFTYAAACHFHERFPEATESFRRAIELPGLDARQLAALLGARGLSFGRQGRTDEAVADFTRVIELPGAPSERVARALGGIVCLRLSADDWGAAAEQLAGFLAQELKPASTIADVTEAVVAAIFRQIASPEVWRARAVETVSLYVKHELLPQLGDALVRHLSQLAKSPLSGGGLDQWLAGWESAGSGQSALQLPLRLLRAGIAYLKTEPRDEGALLQLPSEERTLVRQALGLQDEPSK